MKTKIISLAIVLVLVQIMVLPALASAATSGDTVITGNLAATVSSVTPSSGVQGNTYASVVITGSDFTGATAVSFGADITVNSYLVDSDTQITASITIASGATPGTRDVTVTVAGVDGTKSAAFTVNAVSFSITAPSGFALSNMAKGQTATGHSTTPGTVTTNAASWTVVAKDSNTGGNKGYMLKGGSVALANQFRIGKASSGPWTNAGDVAGLTYTQAGGTSLPFYVEQDVASDAAIGVYSITISFVGSTP